MIAAMLTLSICAAFRGAVRTIRPVVVAPLQGGYESNDQQPVNHDPGIGVRFLTDRFGATEEELKQVEFVIAPDIKNCC